MKLRKVMIHGALFLPPKTALITMASGEFQGTLTGLNIPDLPYLTLKYISCPCTASVQTVCGPMPARLVSGGCFSPKKPQWQVLIYLLYGKNWVQFHYQLLNFVQTDKSKSNLRIHETAWIKGWKSVGFIPIQKGRRVFADDLPI